MTNARVIRVFLASSITEFKNERIDISDSISGDLTQLFKKDNITVIFCKCDSIHSGNVGPHDQEEIDNQLRECDVSLFLFKTKEGENTIHEYKVARELQKVQKHEIFVYYLHEKGEKRVEGITPFQERMKDDGVYWKDCVSLMEVKYMFAMGLLKSLNIRCGESVQASEKIEEGGDALFEQYLQNRQPMDRQMHQEIEKILAQIKPIMGDPDTPVTAKVVQVLGIYQKADLWASKTDYDKEKYRLLLSNYAKFLNKYGMYYDAEKVCLHQIALAEELYGKEHENTAKAYHTIGIAYRKQGNYLKALECYDKTLKIREKDLGTEHPTTATTLNNIGMVYSRLDDIVTALNYYQKALKIRVKILGINHRNTASTYNNIGQLYYKQANYSKALEYYLKALEIKVKVLGSDRPSIATTYGNIGKVYEKQGEYSKALNYHKKALDIRKNHLGIEHPSVAITYTNFGLIYQNQKDYSKALEYYQKALKIKEKVLGTEHPSTATTYYYIGSMFYELKKYPEALKYLEKALQIRKAKLGDKHPNTITTQKWIDATIAAMSK